MIWLIKMIWVYQTEPWLLENFKKKKKKRASITNNVSQFH